MAQGSPVTFTVGVSGEAPFTYQWRKGGAPIDGANGASYTINNAQPSDEASYDVIVSNLVGSATSAAATLAIMVAPEITQQPASLTVVCGTTATFTVAASGTSPNYQWYYNDTNLLTGETSASLVLNNVMLSQAGTYKVVVSNGAGSVTSSSATLSVTATAPTIGTIAYSGGAFHFTFGTEPGCTYIIEYKHNVDDLEWTLLATVPGNGSPAPIDDPAPAPDQRFYRVRVK